jgi:PAS domain S-box-containing protein
LVLIWFSGLVEVSYESPMAALLLNLVSITGVSAAGVWLAVRGYLASGLSVLLYAGCGLVAMGSGILIASFLIGGPEGPNDAVTVHNLSVLLAALMHLAAAVSAGQPRSRGPVTSTRKAVLALAGVLVLTGLIWAVVSRDWVPLFYIAGEGATPVRQLALTLSIALLSVAAAFLLREAMRRANPALRVYGLGLILISLGIADVSIAAPGSVLSWTGRLSQSLGHIYLLAAFLTAIRALAQKGFDIRTAAAEYYLESEANYRALVDTLRAAVISVDPSGRVVLWNPQAEAIFGHNYGEVAGKPLMDLIVPAGDGRRALQDLLEQRPGRYVSLALRRKNGDEFPVEALVFEGSGAGTMWTNWVIRDVSGHRQIEEELRKRELRIRQALQVSRSFAFEWEPATDKVTRSEDCAPLLGLSGPEVIHDSGENFFRRVHPEDRERFVGLVRALTPYTPSYTTTYRVMRPDGSFIILQEAGIGFFDAEQRLSLLAGISTDVTELEQSREEIVYLATFPRLNPNPIVEADMDGQPRFCNPSAERLFPDIRQRGTDHPWLSDWEAVRLSTAQRGAGMFRREVAVGDRWYHQAMHYVPESRCVRIYGLDISGLKTAEKKLRENQADLNYAQAVGRIGSWRLNIQRNELLWSDENHRIFGLPKGTPMSYETFLGTVHPEDREYVDRKWSAALRGEPYDIVHRLVVGNAVKWVRERAELEFSADGKLLGGFGITQDITEHKLADEAMRESEARFRLLAHTAEDLLTARHPQEHIDTLAARVMAQLDCQCFFNFLVADGQPGRLKLNAWAGIPEDEARRIEWLDYGAAVCGCVARDGARIVAEHISTTPDVRTELVKSYGIQAYACHPLVGVNGRVLGTLSFGTRSRETFSSEDLALMKAVADQVAMALVRMQNEQDLHRSADALQKANERLEEMVRLRTLELEDTVSTLRNEILVRKKIQAQLHQLSRKSLEALEADRRTVARELHDSIGGSLAAIKFGLEEVAERTKEDPACGVQSMGALVSHLADTIKETKRISANLRPLAIDDLGLLATIEWYTQQFCQRYETIRVVCQIDVEEQEIPEEFKIVLYRVMQEALTNVSRHSQADAVTVRLTKSATHFEFEVEDNGCGFDASNVFGGPDRLSGYGLKSMQERAEICGGILNLRTRPNAGTSVKVSLPFTAASGFSASAADLAANHTAPGC